MGVYERVKRIECVSEREWERDEKRESEPEKKNKRK